VTGNGGRSHSPSQHSNTTTTASPPKPVKPAMYHNNTTTTTSLGHIINDRNIPAIATETKNMPQAGSVRAAMEALKRELPHNA
jgi:hypothetical protein